MILPVGYAVMTTMLAASGVTEPALRTRILDAARLPVTAALGKPVLFKVNHLARAGDWAFLYADMQDRGGKAVDLTGTPLGEAAAEGMASKACAVLLHRTGETWKAVETKVGPTDVAWDGWAAKHGAPPAIFRF